MTSRFRIRFCTYTMNSVHMLFFYSFRVFFEKGLFIKLKKSLKYEFNFEKQYQSGHMSMKHAYILEVLINCHCNAQLIMQYTYVS